MPICPNCGGHGIIPLISPGHPGASVSPYRQCPVCNGKGSISEEAKAKREYQQKKRESEKDRPFGIMLIAIGALIIYFGVDKIEDFSAKMIVIIVAVVLLLYGGKHL